MEKGRWMLWWQNHKEWPLFSSSCTIHTIILQNLLYHFNNGTIRDIGIYQQNVKCLTNNRNLNNCQYDFEQIIMLLSLLTAHRIESCYHCQPLLFTIIYHNKCINRSLLTFVILDHFFWNLSLKYVSESVGLVQISSFL